MKNKIIGMMLLAMATFMFISCEKYNEDDKQTNNNKEANSTLTVRTRAAENTNTENTTISYPVNIYIFNNNQCVEAKTIETADAEISFKLPEGSYSVYAIAGADAESYDLPTKENATEETVISLKSSKSHGDIMTAQNTVKLAYGEDNTLTLSLKRKVMLIETVTINNVPSNVTAVSIEISPLYKNILLNGGYSSEKDGAQKIDLTEDVDGSTWKNTSGTYLFEASGQATIKVSLTTANGTKSYSYSSTGELKANHKINITGTYNENGIALNGTITGCSWEEPVNITFNFDETGSSTEENTGGNNEETGDIVNDKAPQAGTLYKDCYVLKSEKTDKGTVVTLMSTGYKDRLEFTKGDQESMKTAINTAISQLANPDISSWRLPSLEELKYIKDHISEIGNNLTQKGKDNFPPDSFYFYLTQDNKISTFNTSTDDIIETPSSGGAKFILRAFATITFTK